MDFQNCKFQIYWRNSFTEDLSNIYYYHSKILKEPYVAESFHNKIKSSLATLEYFPEGYSSRKLKDKTYRKLIIDNYIIIYEVNKDTGQVFILHIFHGSQNYLHLL